MKEWLWGVVLGKSRCKSTLKNYNYSVMLSMMIWTLCDLVGSPDSG